MALPKSVKVWADATEKNTRSRKPKNIDIAEAKRFYLKKLKLADQMALAEEIVVTRSAELCRAYPNVVDVAFGYGRRSVANSKMKHVRQTPCVTFIVRTKWRSKSKSDDSLPTHLFAYWRVGRTRKLCAVPTDVEPASAFANIEPQATRPHIAVKNPGTNKAVRGTVTCAIKRKGDNALYALSCRHVFSISKYLHGKPDHPNEVRLKTSRGKIFAKSTRLRGKLGKQGALSFDAQLAQVYKNKLAVFRQALGSLKFKKHAQAISEIPKSFRIHPPRTMKGNPAAPLRIKTKQIRFAVNRILNYGEIGQVTHALLIEVQPNQPTKKGDSGSPAVTNSGDTLLGMNIAGKNGLSYLIPAWQLLNPRNYGRREEKWHIVNI